MDYAERIRQSFSKQGLMSTLDATLGKIEPGSVEISLAPNPAITQQHGFVHAGAVSAIADTAAGYAAMTLAREGVGISYAIAEELIRLKVRRILFLLFFQLILFQVFRIFCNVRWFNVWILLPWSYRQFLQPFQ